MKKISILLAVMMAASNLQVQAQNIYVDNSNGCSKPQVELTNDTLSVFWMSDDSDSQITEVRYRYDSSEPWIKEKSVVSSSCRFTLKIPRKGIAGPRVEYMVVAKNRNQISCTEGEIHLDLSSSCYGVNPNGQRHPMW